MHLRNLWTAVAVLVGCAREKLIERPITGLGTVRVPGRIEPRPALLNNWYGTSLYLTRSMNSVSAMGSNSPQHENLLITQLHPVLVHRRGIELLDQVEYVFEYTRDVQWDAVAPRGSYQFRYGTGRYTPNTMDKPAVLAQGFDVARGLAVSYRGLESEIARKDVEALLDSVMASYKATVDLPTYFSAIERDLGAGVTIALPIELTDPFSWESDPSGVQWMYFRRHREWSEDPEIPERTTAVTAFFAPGNTDQATAARAIVEREIGAEKHPSWLATRVDAARGVAVSVRAWKSSMTEDGVTQLASRIAASYRFTGDSTFFQSKSP